MTVIRAGHGSTRRRKSHGTLALTDVWEQLRRDLRPKPTTRRLRAEDRPRGATPLTPGATVVLGHLSDEPLRAKDIAALTGFRVQQANNFVLQLSARGLATRTREGWVRS